MTKLVPGIVLGRRFCTGDCGRWRHICDFSPRKWNKDGTLKYTSTECRVCKRRRENKRWQDATPVVKKRRNAAARAHYRRKRRQAGITEIGARVVTGGNREGSVRREPFANWLRNKLSDSNYHVVSFRTGLHPRYINMVLNGYAVSGKRVGGKKRKLIQVDHIELATVDAALQKWGESPKKLDELYPDGSAVDTP